MRHGMAIGTAAALMASGVAAQYRPAPPLMMVTDADDGRVLRVPVGAEISVRLPENDGTPYQWMMRNDQRIVQIGQPTTGGRDSRNVVGARFYRTFRVRVREAGRVPLVFGLRSVALGNDQTPARRVQFTIDATESRSPPAPPRPGPIPTLSQERRPLSDEPSGDADHPLDERDTFTSVKPGQEIFIRLPSNASTGYSWQIIDMRNLAMTAPIRVEPDRRGFLGVQVGNGDHTIIRVVTTSTRGDGFLTLGYFAPGKRADRFSAVRTLEYHLALRR